MAFNYRPKTSTEILAKKQINYYEELALIFDSVWKKYGVGIIIDPSNGQIKIPTTLQKNGIMIGNVKKYIASDVGVDIKKFKMTFGMGSGAGGNDAGVTKKQEEASALYFKNYFESNTHSTIEQLQKVYPSIPPAMMNSYMQQALAFEASLSGLGASKSTIKKMEYSRGNGVMKLVEDFVLSNSPISSKDSWNPADIYISKKSSIPAIKKELIEIKKRFPKKSFGLVEEVNSLLKRGMANGTIFPVSLKLIKTTAKGRYEISNYDKAKKKPVIKVKSGSANFKLGISNNNFDTGELKFVIFVNDEEVTVQIRTFSGAARETTQIELIPKSGAAKFGKVSTKMAIDPFLQKMGLKRLMSREIPKVGKLEEDYINNLFNSTKITQTGLGSINFNVNSFKKEGKANMIYLSGIEDKHRLVANRISSKIQGMRWLNIMYTLNKKNKFPEFLDMLYNGAKKTYKTAGPFIKVH